MLSEFQGYDADYSEQDGDDDEALHDFLFGNAFLLVVMVQGGHQEGSFLDGNGCAQRNLMLFAVEFASRCLDDY